MPKSDREIMEILEAFDLTRCPEAAGRLAGCDAKTVKHHVNRRDAGLVPVASARRDRIIDPFVEKIEELVERSRGDIRADIVHNEHLMPMGFAGDERTTRRAVAVAKTAWFAGRRRTYRPWVPEPGMWLQTGARGRTSSDNLVPNRELFLPQNTSLTVHRINGIQQGAAQYASGIGLSLLVVRSPQGNPPERGLRDCAALLDRPDHSREQKGRDEEESCSISSE